MLSWKYQTARKYLLVLIVIGIVIRICLFLVYQPNPRPDTGEYFDHAEFLLGVKEPEWEYHGVRTPGYPLLIILAGFNYQKLWFFQSVMGVIVSVILFELAYLHKSSAWLSFALGLAYTFSMNMIFYEATFLTEPVAGFSLMLSLLFLAYWKRSLDKSDAQSIAYLLVATLSIILGFLTRPQLLFVVPVYAIYIFILLMAQKAGIKKVVSGVAAFLIPCLIVFLGWSAFNKIKIGYFTYSTVTGYNLMYHTGYFIESAPDKDETIKEIFIKYRDAEIARIGTQGHAVWPAGKEIQQLTGISFEELSNLFVRLSIDLILKNPGKYLESVLKASIDFWKVYNSWDPDFIALPRLRSVLSSFWAAERLGLIALNFLFLSFSIASIWGVLIKKQSCEFMLYITLVIAACLFTAILIIGANARYAMPFQPVILFVTFVGFPNLFSSQVMSSLKSRLGNHAISILRQWVFGLKQRFKYGFTYNPKRYWSIKGISYRDEYHRRFERRLRETGYDRNLSLITETLKQLEFTSLLDVGCGYGLYLQQIDRVFPKLEKIHGCDISPTMVEEAKHFLGYPSKIVIDETDGKHLPYPDKSFDSVMTYGVCIHVTHENIEDFIREILRVSKKVFLLIESSRGTDGFEYFSHDYPAIFHKLGYALQTLKELNTKNKECLYLVVVGE